MITRKLYSHPFAVKANCLQQDVEVPLSLLLDLIKERDGGGPPHQAEGMGIDSSTLLYLAQKDVHSLLPHLALDPALLPLKASLSLFSVTSMVLRPCPKLGSIPVEVLVSQE